MTENGHKILTKLFLHLQHFIWSPEEGRGGEEMFCKKGEFLYLTGGFILEVIYADREMAVCIEVKKVGNRYHYTERSVVISNEAKAYVGEDWISKGDALSVLKTRLYPPSEMRIKVEHRIDEAVRDICGLISEAMRFKDGAYVKLVPEMTKALAKLVSVRNDMQKKRKGVFLRH